MDVKSTGIQQDWLTARDLTRKDGGLPSNVLLDDVLVNLKRWELPGEASGPFSSKYVWARELVVTPKAGGIFESNRDVVVEDWFTSKWVLPAQCIPEEAIGRRGVALFVDPDDVVVEGNTVTVIARSNDSIKIVENFLQDDNVGKVDQTTRLPVKASSDELDQLADEDKRYLWRAVLMPAIRPISRIFNFNEDYGHVVVLNETPEYLRWVMTVAFEEIVAVE